MTQTDVMTRSFLIAAVIVLPYAIYKIRQVHHRRQHHGELIADEVATEMRANQPFSELPALEDVIGDVGYVVAEARRAGGAILVVPDLVTVSDRPASADMVDLLVRDALRRSGLVVTSESDSSEGRIFECALREQADESQP